MLIWLLHVYFISLTNIVYNGFEVTIHKYYIQINIYMNLNINIECLFSDVLGPKAHQGDEDKLSYPPNALYLICLHSLGVF